MTQRIPTALAAAALLTSAAAAQSTTAPVVPPVAPTTPAPTAAPPPAPAIVAPPQNLSALSLDDAIKLALSNQNLIAIAQSQQRAAGERVTESKSTYFPAVTPSFQYSRQRTAFDAGQGTQVGTLTQHVTSIGLTQTIYDAGRTQQNVALSKDQVRSAAFNVLDVRQTVISTVASDWYDLLRTKELVRVAESNADRSKTTLEATQAFVAAGSSARKDVLQAQADYDNANILVIEARNNVSLAQTALKNAIGITTSEKVDAEQTTVSAPPATPDTKTVADYTSLAISNRPDLKRAQSDIEASQRTVKIARIGAGLQITSSFTAGYRVSPDPGFDNSLGLGVTYPLFDAGAARAAVREAKDTVQQSQQQLELTRQAIAANVETAYLQREEARQRIGAANTALIAARENYEAASESQKEGVSTILDVITAQNLLVTAETNSVQAIYDFYTADAQLQRAVGGNDPYIAPGKAT